MRVHLLIFSLLISFFVLGGNTSFAGFIDENPPRCTKYADGSGTCEGTFIGFRNTANSKDNVFFQTDSRASEVFFAELNSQYYICFINNASPDLQKIFDLNLTGHGRFWISWDANLNCNEASYVAGSAYMTP